MNKDNENKRNYARNLKISKNIIWCGNSLFKEFLHFVFDKFTE